jgi:hypothetical protein
MHRLWLGLFMVLLAACTHPAAAGSSRSTPSPATQLEFSARVVMVRIEGGFCGLITADGRRFEPVNLPADFCRDGLPVQVSGTLVPGGVTMRMWGRPLRIESIRRR